MSDDPSEQEKPAVVQPGMLLKVLRNNPMKAKQTACIDPGYYKEFMDSFTILVNSRDFDWFAEECLKHNLKMNKVKDDEEGNPIYRLEEGNVIVI